MSMKIRIVCMTSLLIVVIYLLVSTQNCSCKCKFDWKPLCASNGKTYPSKCLFDCTKKCGKNDNVTVVKEGRCHQGLHSRNTHVITPAPTALTNETTDTAPTKKPKASSKTKTTTESELVEKPESEVTEPSDL